MTILLAPMEGLLDHPLREVLTEVGGIDRCVTEFIRITDQLLPARVFTRVMPELFNGSRTRAGTPVRAQLLGSDPNCLAENAARLAELGAEGIDLNFGCPAKTVNRHRGGAVLLDEPELLHAIMAAVRRAVPADLPVSAKMRLGHRDDERRIEAAQALAAGGAGELVVHARTKLQGYRPPAFWHRVADIRAAVAIPVVANGEIWTASDAQRARAESGCHGLMLGRGQVADPGLAWALRAADGAAPHPVTWAGLQPGLSRFWALVALKAAPRFRAGRMKQWLNLLRRRYPEAQAAFEQVRAVTDPAAVAAVLGLSTVVVPQSASVPGPPDLTLAG
ncbi:MAG: tRNA-dihydrouridine synthase [Rubrivivax sp.]|nr:tRNA-dihydrouridine synthase [Rubrivivax sp.]